MREFFRPVWWVLIASLLAGGVAAQTAGSTAPGGVPVTSAWHQSGSLRTSVGWRDNLLLSPFDPMSRWFGRAEMEAILFRPLRDRWEFVSFVSGDVSRYFSPPVESGGEQQWLGQVEGRWQPVDAARLSLRTVGFLRDMVVDLSESEARRVVAPTRVRGAYVTAAGRLNLPAGFRFEPSVQIKRNDYRDYAGDYDEARTGGRIEWRRTPALVLSAAWFELRRSYDQRSEYTAGGRALPGTQLRFRQRETEFRAATRWQGSAEWTLAATVGRRDNRDGASGYFDYDQDRARLELGWQSLAWRVIVDAEAKRMEYRVQTVGAGIAPPPRFGEDFETLLRVERELTARWLVFAEHRWERSRSNELEFQYRANTMLAGVQCNF